MMDLKRYEGPYGIPVYHQRVPEMLKASSIAWVLMTGAADDESIGSPGLYHWFEHVPFRGTKKYPDVTENVVRPFNRLGGNVGAWTNEHATCFYSELPVREWRQGLSAITDLLSHPLLRAADVEAERNIIRQEIIGCRSKSARALWYEIPKILWNGHPFGHHTLGNEDALDMMSPEIMLDAHAKGYDRSRLSFFAVGNMSIEEVLEEVGKVADQLPSAGLSERRRPAHFGALPDWKPGKTTVLEMGFPSSTTAMLFPHPNDATMEDNFFRGRFLGKLFNQGSLASPLMRILREERHLVYSAGAFNNMVPGGGVFALQAEAKRQNIGSIVEAFRDTIADPSVCSQERVEEIVEGTINRMEMALIDPDEYLSTSIDLLLETGQVFGYEKFQKKLKSLTVDHAHRLVSDLRPEDAHIIVLEGTGKEKE